MARACTLLLFYCVLAYLANTDYRKRKISNWCHAAILFLTLIAALTIPEITLKERVGGMFLISMPMFLLAVLSPGSLGGGDVKLSFACGAFLGGERILRGTVIAIVFAGIYCLWLLLEGKANKNTQLALGPFLSIGYVAASLTLF